MTAPRCAWPQKPLPCDQPAPFQRAGSMLRYCHDHYLTMLANRDTILQPLKKAS